MSVTEVSPDSSSPIPVPPSFPVRWEEPDEERLFWIRDRMHFPDPWTPMNCSLFTACGVPGFNGAAEAYDLPIRTRVRCINTYFYQTMTPLPLSPEEMQALGMRSQQKLGAALASLAESWNGEYLPEIKRYLAEWEAFDLAGASTPELLEHLDRTVSRLRRLWEIHFLVGFAYLVGMSLFEDLYRDLFGGQTAFGAYALLQGFDNKSLETDRAVWRLARQAATSPAVRAILEERAAADVLPALAEIEEGRRFKLSLRGFLDDYGRRASAFAEVANPSWIEDPAPLIKNLKDYIGQPERDLDAELTAAAEERERLLAEVRERLASYPEEVAGQIEFLLKAAQTGTVLAEDHNYWIDCRSVYEVRRVILELGRRLAGDGTLSSPDDVFYLTLAEVRQSLRPSPPPELGRVTAGRRAELAYFRTVEPPLMLGTLPPGPAPENPFTRAVEKFFGAPPRPAAEMNALSGIAGSPGTVRGPARVVRSLAEAGKLRAGDILVAETTAPPWTPLFATAAGIVTDTGGVLSHCAVVAREYRIPAVVGTGRATAVIRDGQMIEVDGDAGVVRVI